MATVNIYGPSSHSQTVDTGTTIVAEATVVNGGTGMGYATMVIGGAVLAQGNRVNIAGKRSATVRATYYLGSNYAGQTLSVSAYLYEVTQGGSVIKSITSPHNNFRIYVRKPYVPPPPVQPPWYDPWKFGG